MNNTNELKPVSNLHIVFSSDGSAATVCRTAQDAHVLIASAAETTSGKLKLETVSLADVIGVVQHQRRISQVAGEHKVDTAHYSSSTLIEELTALRHRLAEAERIRPVCPECRILVQGDECSGCGVWFNNPCDTCGAPGYHTRDCEELVESTAEDTGKGVPR